MDGRRTGAILITAIWVLFFLAALVLVLARSVRTDLLACANEVALIQASAVERGAEQYVLALIDQQKDSVLTLAESNFAGIQLNGGFFWVLRPSWGDDAIPSFGVVDESAKVNLNTATSDMLLALPGMTADLAASIVDWRDSDSDATAGGAEDDYYLALPRPYRAKNAPFETVEELLLVKGATTDLLYGTGTGSRYIGQAIWEAGLGSTARTDLQLDRGIYDDLTVYSVESGGDTGGQSQVNVNDESPMRLSELLSQVLGAARAEEIGERARPRPPFRDPFDFAVRAGLTAKELDSLSSRITTGARPSSSGLVNIDTAPQEVLQCLPGMTQGDVASLISGRLSAGTSGIGWVLEALGSKSVGLWNLITTRSYQYSADILAASENGRAFRRLRLVFDSRTSPPKVIFRRDLGETGWPLDPAILLSLREGSGLPAAYSALQGAL